jgi:hypothetical protein
MDMSQFENVLQECLRDLEQGGSNLEECLRRYPKHAAQLEPILLASASLARGREARLSLAFKARVRKRLVQQMYAHPRRLARPTFGFIHRTAPLVRLAASLAAVLLVLLAAGTVYAQRALPGEAFYAWKIASENAWRLVSPDPLGTDLAIAERRLDELIAVRNSPALQAQTLAAYLELTARLRAQLDPENEARILDVLDAQAEQLSQLDILPEETIPNGVPPLDGPTATPITTPLPILVTPPVNSTELPHTVPTVEVVPTAEVLPTSEVRPTVEIVPEILPTVQKPPRPLPTIEISPPIH